MQVKTEPGTILCKYVVKCVVVLFCLSNNKKKKKKEKCIIAKMSVVLYNRPFFSMDPCTRALSL